MIAIFPNYDVDKMGVFEVVLGLFALKLHDWLITKTYCGPSIGYQNPLVEFKPMPRDL